MDSSQINLAKLADANHWTRIVLTVLFIFLLRRFALLAIELITILQVLVNLFTSKPHASLTNIAKSLTVYVTQINQFVTYQSEARPFPFSPWPK